MKSAASAPNLATAERPGGYDPRARGTHSEGSRDTSPPATSRDTSEADDGDSARARLLEAYYHSALSH